MTDPTQQLCVGYGYNDRYADDSLSRGARIAIGVCVAIGGLILIIAIGMFVNRYCSRPFRPRISTTNVGSGGPGMPHGYYGTAGQPYQPQAYPMGMYQGYQGNYGGGYNGGYNGGYGGGNNYAPPPGPPPGHESTAAQYAPPEGPPPGHEKSNEKDGEGAPPYAPPEGPPPSQNAYAPPTAPPPAHTS